MSIVLLALIMVTRAWGGEWCPTPQPQPLSFVFSKAPSAQKPPHVKVQVEENFVIASFHVETDEIFAKYPLASNEYPFQFDVVEIFITASGKEYPYYEFELSPYNENFQVLIEFKNNKKKMTNSVDMGIQTTATIHETYWTAEIRIPLNNLRWSGRLEDIRGNVFAVLGHGPQRSYWSLNLPVQTSPNFHKPEYFCRLIE